MEKNLFQQAKDAMSQMKSNKKGSANENDQEAARSAIQEAEAHASPQEKQQLEELKQQLEGENNSK